MFVEDHNEINGLHMCNTLSRYTGFAAVLKHITEYSNEHTDEQSSIVFTLHGIVHVCAFMYK